VAAYGAIGWRQWQQLINNLWLAAYQCNNGWRYGVLAQYQMSIGYQ